LSCISGNPPQHVYISYKSYLLPYWLQHPCGTSLVAFLLFSLKYYYSTSSSEKMLVISFHLAPVTWRVLISLKRVASSAKTLFWSCFKYSSSFFFFFSKSFYFLAFSLALASTFLTFWAACSMWQASAASSKWAWSLYAFSVSSDTVVQAS